MRNHILRSCLAWVPLGVAITVLSLSSFGAVQQELRQSANDPQIQMSEDTAADIATGQTQQIAAPVGSVDIVRSLAPFLIVYDDSGNITESSARLNGQTPPLPAGVLDFTRRHRQDRFTWQPAPGVRSAVVLTRYEGAGSGFVLAGRSLREVEARESQIQQIALAGWLVALAASLITVFLAGLFAPFARMWLRRVEWRGVRAAQE